MIRWFKGYFISSKYAKDISNQSWHTNLDSPCSPLRRATDGDNRNQWFPATDLASFRGRTRTRTPRPLQISPYIRANEESRGHSSIPDENLWGNRPRLMIRRARALAPIYFWQRKSSGKIYLLLYTLWKCRTSSEGQVTRKLQYQTRLRDPASWLPLDAGTSSRNLHNYPPFSWILNPQAF